VRAGIKPSGNLDLGLLVSDVVCAAADDHPADALRALAVICIQTVTPPAKC